MWRPNVRQLIANRLNCDACLDSLDFRHRKIDAVEFWLRCVENDIVVFQLVPRHINRLGSNPLGYGPIATRSSFQDL